MHVHICQLYRSAGVQRYVAAAEQGAGVYFDPVEPSAAAAQLRALPGGDGAEVQSSAQTRVQTGAQADEGPVS